MVLGQVKVAEHEKNILVAPFCIIQDREGKFKRWLRSPFFDFLAPFLFYVSYVPISKRVVFL